MHLTIFDQSKTNLNKYKKALKDTFKIKAINNPITLLTFLEKSSTDMLLLGIDKPPNVSFELYNLLQEKFKRIPTIFAGQNIGEAEVVRGMDLGADDVIKHPVTKLEFIARIKNKVLKYERLSAYYGREVNGKISLNDDLETLLIGGKKYILTPQEYKIVSILSSNTGKVHTSLELKKALWGNRDVTGHALATHITNLKGKVPELEEIIVNKRGRGYYLDLG